MTTTATGVCPTCVTGCGCKCVCLTQEYPYIVSEGGFDPACVVTFSPGVTTVTLPAQTINLTSPACVDVAYTGSIINIESGETLLQVAATIVLTNALTPSVVFGPATAAAPTVTTLPGSAFPISVRYVTCQPRGVYSVAVQLTLIDPVPVEDETFSIAFNGLLSITAKKC